MNKYSSPRLVVRHQLVPAVNLSPLKGEPILEDMAALEQAEQEDRMEVFRVIFWCAVSWAVLRLIWWLW